MKTPNWFNIVPQKTGSYLGVVLKKYKYEICIDVDNMTLDDLVEMENWCNKNFGQLQEDTVKSPWNLACDLVRIQDTQYHKEIFCFFFHKEEDAAAFKLRWN